MSDTANCLAYLHDPGAVFELCIIRPQKPTSELWTGRANGKKATISGWFTDPEAAAKRAVEISEKVKAEGIYTTLNPCKEALLARANHRLEAYIDRTADAHIDQIKNLLIDIDPDPGGVSGVSSTDKEHQAALEMAQIIQGDMTKAGWPEPLVGDSGNGAHLIYPMDLPNNHETVTLIKEVLTALSLRYQDDLAGRNLGIDQAVFNPARLTKLYGTMVRKGDNTKTRPHRLSRILSLPEKRQPVSRELLQKLVATILNQEDTKDRSPGNGKGQVDVSAYLAHYGVQIVKEKPYQGGTLFCLQTCLFNKEHTGNEAAIGRAADGKLFYQCFHDTCQGRTWAEARRIISGGETLGQFMVGGAARTHSSECIHDHVFISSRGVVTRELITKVEIALTTAHLDPQEIAYVTNLLKQSYQDIPIAQRVREWLMVTTGNFLVTDVYKDLGLVTPGNKKAALMAIKRIEEEGGPIEKYGDKRGCYRIVDRFAEEIDFVNVPDGPGLNIKWPFGLENLIETYEKTINIVAGDKDAGKTAWLLNFIRKNMNDFPIVYFSSEMGAKQLNVRLKKFGYPLESWMFKAKERSANFADVIEPDAINVIDFLEISDNFYQIAKLIKEIYDKLRNGIAIIAIQKDEGAKIGRGKDFSKEKSRLYVTLEKGNPYNKMEIMVGKNWASDRNPVSITYQFKLVQGAKIINAGEVIQ